VSGAVPLRIDIWSDVVCPWCLVGWGNLTKALRQLEDEVMASLHWRAFELNPDMPSQGEEQAAHLARKYGPGAGAGMGGRMRAAAREAGVSLGYEGPEPAPPAMMWNTFDAHRLLAWSGEECGQAGQTALALALFRAHFSERLAIGEREVLLDVARSAGFERADATRAFECGKFAEQVRADERQAMDRGTTGVPAMVVEDGFLIPGAQGAATYVDALRRIAGKKRARA
jgi:predicted DsbA family dithiol-disulfide isomerase